MTRTPRNHAGHVAIALIGLAFIGGGLWLAVLSNPQRFSMSVTDDRNIQLFAFSGFACTLAGIGLFLVAVRSSTTTMPEQLRKKANIGVGLGFVLQLAGLFLADVPSEIGWALILAGLIAIVWGTIHYAQGKGYSKSLGLLGICGIVGLIVLVLLPHNEAEPTPTNST